MMTVYVDSLMGTAKTTRWPYDQSCHLFADSLDELHAFAENIGLRRSWFQGESFPHYDLTAAVRANAIRCGAVPLSLREGARKVREIRAKSRRETQ